MISEENNAVLVIGGRGEFGQFLQHDILPILGAVNILMIERETPRDESLTQLQRARHIVLATPLAGYAELACELVYLCRDLRTGAAGMRATRAARGQAQPPLDQKCSAMASPLATP